jgi:hypothetical protein
MRKIQQRAAYVKAKAALKPACLASVILEKHHFGEPDEIVFLPICSACRKVITDLKSANIEAVDGTPIPVGEMDGMPISRVDGPVFIFHKPECVSRRLLGPWKRADTVIRNDQRYGWEQ